MRGGWGRHAPATRRTTLARAPPTLRGRSTISVHCAPDRFSTHVALAAMQLLACVATARALCAPRGGCAERRRVLPRRAARAAQLQWRAAHRSAALALGGTLALAGGLDLSGGLPHEPSALGSYKGRAAHQRPLPRRLCRASEHDHDRSRNTLTARVDFRVLCEVNCIVLLLLSCSLHQPDPCPSSNSPWTLRVWARLSPSPP